MSSSTTTTTTIQQSIRSLAAIHSFLENLSLLAITLFNLKSNQYQWVYPDQSHSLPQVRQHQYLAMEDFLEATFQDNPSISRNDHQLYWDMDSLLLPTKLSENPLKSSNAELPNQDYFENSD